MLAEVEHAPCHVAERSSRLSWRVALFGAPTEYRGIDTFVMESQLSQVQWELYGQALLVDSSGKEPREMPLPHRLLVFPKSGTGSRVPRRRLVVYVDDVEDPATERRVFIALIAANPLGGCS